MLILGTILLCIGTAILRLIDVTTTTVVALLLMAGGSCFVVTSFINDIQKQVYELRKELEELKEKTSDAAD